MEFYEAHMDTRHYSFQAFGSTEADAKAAMELTIATHFQQAFQHYPENHGKAEVRAAIKAFWAEHEMQIDQRRLGAGYRDSEQVG